MMTFAVVLGAPSGVLAQARRPVYVGAKVCATCHDGKSMGHQTTLWLGTKHAKAYASLAGPEARAIAAISGVPIEPRKSPLCLGCHATAADAEDSEKDDTFSIRDGVQCEKCHGPGSEHVDSWSGGSNPSVPRIRLTSPLGADCMKCHKEKPSHTRSLPQTAQRRHRGTVPFPLAQALHDLAHPTPRDGKPGPGEPPRPPADPKAGAEYTGSQACAVCHDVPEKGSQFSRWQTSKHADAYASLASPAGYKIAEQMGVVVEPQASQTCLKCHGTAYHRASAGVAESYSVLEGVGCEACHGPGSSHAADPLRKDASGRISPGLLSVDRAGCLSCHENAHVKAFDYETALREIAHPARAPLEAKVVQYRTPLNVALRPGSRELYVTCEAASLVAVVDTASERMVAEIPVGGQPTDLTFSPDGKRAYVTNRLDDSLSVVDTETRKVTATVPVGDEPHGVRTDASGKTLYVLNTSSDDISVIDAGSLRELKRLAAGRSPWALALSPSGGRLLITNALSQFVKFRDPPRSEITVVDTGQSVIEDRLRLAEANMLLGIAWHPGGEFAIATLLRSKNLVPMTRMLQGWTVTNGLGLIWPDGRVDQVLLDEPDSCFPDPTTVAFTPDGTHALVTSAGSDRVAVIDIARLRKVIVEASDNEREQVLPNHLCKATEFKTGLIPTGTNPRGLAVSADGKTAFVACALDDSITVIDIESRKAVRTIDLNGPREITEARRGERLFNSAGIAFHRQLSCHTCHPDGHVDGLTYDIEADGIGLAPVDNRTLRGILDTGPFKWAGTNATLARQCGPRLSVFFTRIQPFTPQELSAVDHYISTIPRPPNRHRPLGAELTAAQRRGKQLFERATTNDGRPIHKLARCVSCHFPPLFTDREKHDVGTRMALDVEDKVDVPHLNNIYDSAPYLHNGIADSLEEIWTRFNPNDRHGVTNDMTKDQLNDLIEYLKTL
jgi:YVTN family beta-propeller protein